MWLNLCVITIVITLLVLYFYLYCSLSQFWDTIFGQDTLVDNIIVCRTFLGDTGLVLLVGMSGNFMHIMLINYQEWFSSEIWLLRESSHIISFNFWIHSTQVVHWAHTKRIWVPYYGTGSSYNNKYSIYESSLVTLCNSNLYLF